MAGSAIRHPRWGDIPGSVAVRWHCGPGRGRPRRRLASADSASRCRLRASAKEVDDLADAYRCLSFDKGRSQPLGAPLSVAQMAEDARVLMDAQGWTSAHVVGHSMCGLVALELALSARERVRSLALLYTFAGGVDMT